MLTLLPPSESKTAPAQGQALDLARLLGAPALTPAREELIDRLAAVSAGPDAAEALGLGPRSAGEASANLVLREAPCAPAHTLFTGVLYDAARLGEAAGAPGGAVALGRVVVVSGLWGAVRATDPLPDHRLSMGTRLPGAGALAPWWRTRLSHVLDPLAEEEGLVLDCRSGAYAPAWRAPRGASLTTLAVRVVDVRGGRRIVVSHFAKHWRGLLAGAAVRAGAAGHAPRSAEEAAGLAEGLGGISSVELAPADRGGRRELTLVLGD